jgi:hypothetical protein
MSRENPKQISVLTVQTEDESQTLSVFPSPSKMLAKSSQVAIDTLAENLTAFVNALGEIVDTVPESCGKYNVDNMSFSLSVDGEGRISLVGELAAGFSSGITVTLRKQKDMK